MSAASRREQQLAAGGVYHPRQRVDVNINGTWRPGQIQNVANFTVRNSITRGETNKPPNQVFAIGGDPNSTGANTHYMPGSPILFQGPHRWIKLLGTLISKNYVVQIDGRTETVPHTRLRIAQIPEVEEDEDEEDGEVLTYDEYLRRVQLEDEEEEARAGEEENEAPQTVIFTRGQQVEVNENGVWTRGEVRGLDDFTVRNTATGRNVNLQSSQVRAVEENIGVNIMPGDRVQFQDGRRLLPGTLVSRNYYVAINNGMIESIPHTRLRLVGQPQERVQQRAQAQPQGLAWEVHNAFADLDLPKFMTIVRRENNGSTNFKDNNNILEPVVSYINSQDTALTSEQKTRYINNIRNSIRQNVNAYIRDHPEVKDNTLEVIQFVLSQDPKYKDLYIETFENECMGGYSRGNKQSCTKGMFERIYMANKGTIEGLCFEELQGGTAAASSCKPIYLELHSAFTPGADIDINDIFQKWYNEFSYDAVPEEENILKNLSVEARKQHYRDFVRQDEAISERIWNNRDFQRKLEESIQKNNIIFETLTLDVGLGKRRRKRRTVKHKKNQKKATMKRLKDNITRGKNKIIRKTRRRY